MISYVGLVSPVTNIISLVNGFITYNTPSYYRGEVFNNVHFKVKNGKIIEASSDNTDKLNEILDIDEGARYFGEFAFGVNTMIKEPMMDILYDEKIAGSIHLTPGTAYPMANNGNQSKIHWDLILRLSKENGGGEVYFDDQLVYKDGCFLDADLKILNPINRN